jgi:WASH complex subunit strumpellin
LSVNFIGRLAREIMRMTDPKTTYYIWKKSAWFDLKTKEEVVNLTLFKKLEQSINTFGLHSLNRLYSFMIVRDLQTFISNMNKFEKSIDDTFKTSITQMLPLDKNSSNFKLYRYFKLNI